MAFGTLWAKLGVDSTEFNRDLNKAAAAGNRFSDQFTRGFGSKLTRAFGAFGLAAGGASLISRIFGSANEISTMARELNVSAEAFQAMERAAQLTGLHMQDIVKLVREGGPEGRKAVLGFGDGTGFTSDEIADLKRRMGILKATGKGTLADMMRIGKTIGAMVGVAGASAGGMRQLPPHEVNAILGRTGGESTDYLNMLLTRIHTRERMAPLVEAELNLKRARSGGNTNEILHALEAIKRATEKMAKETPVDL